MFTTVTIKHFRSFDQLTLKGLSRVNLITGTNGAGKTSLLEAVFLLCGATNATLALALSSFRNDTALPSGTERPFRSLFHGLNVDQPVILSARGTFDAKTRSQLRKLTITPTFSAEVAAPQTDQKLSVYGLTFTFSGPTSKGTGTISWNPSEASSRPFGPPDQSAKPFLPMLIQSEPTPDYVRGHFISPYFRGLWDQLHNQLTEAIKNKKMHEILKYMKIVEPRVQNILPLSEKGGNTLYVDLGMDHLLPISVVGAGFTNLLHIIVDSTFLQDGVLLIDEIEDGLHYSHIPSVIKYLFLVAEENNLQIFVTTHSNEIMSQFRDVCVEIGFKDISLFRLQHKNDKVKVNYYSYDDFLVAEQIRAEIR